MARPGEPGMIDYPENEPLREQTTLPEAEAC